MIICCLILISGMLCNDMDVLNLTKFNYWIFCEIPNIYHKYFQKQCSYPRQPGANAALDPRQRTCGNTSPDPEVKYLLWYFFRLENINRHNVKWKYQRFGKIPKRMARIEQGNTKEIQRALQVKYTRGIYQRRYQQDMAQESNSSIPSSSSESTTKCNNNFPSLDSL